MSDDYILTTAQVKVPFVHNGSPYWNLERSDLFDAWLAAHDAEVRAETQAGIAQAILAETISPHEVIPMAGGVGWTWATFNAARISGEWTP